MNFEELGLTLKRERENKGLSIEMVMEATKISRANIVAMETGDRSAMPHPVYAKGFVKSYARYLGLDEDELSMVVDREFQEDEDSHEGFGYDVAPQAEKAFQEPGIIEGKKKKTWPIFLVLLLLACAVVVLFMNLNGNDLEQADVIVSEDVVEEVEPAPTPAESVTEQETVSDDQTYAESPRTNEETEVVEDDAAQSEEAPSSEVVSPESTQPESAEQETVSEKPAVAPAPAPKPAEDEAVAQEDEEPQYDHMLVIRATTDKGCWIGVWKGDETDMYRDFVLKNGEPLRLNFNTPRRIRIGNASGVDVTYNGEPYELDPARGNIQTHRFGY